MALDKEQNRPHDALSRILADDMDAVNTLIQKRMASEHAPRIPEVTAHLVNAGVQTVATHDNYGCRAVVGISGRSSHSIGRNG